jgi:hypothetical protein
VAIRNATRPVFHKGNSSKKEKEKRTKKEKENGLWKMPQLWKSAKTIGGLRQLLLDADSHSCLEKPRAALGFPTFTTGTTAINQYGTKNLHLKNYKGWLRPSRE